MKSFAIFLFVVSCSFTTIAFSQTPQPKDEHVGNCAKKEGVDKVRCERHSKMAEKCGQLKGDAHFACDREFLMANPLDCSKFSGKAADACNAEVKAFKTCEANQGHEFMKCVKATAGESPMGH
jgi:hypothetical protein